MRSWVLAVLIPLSGCRETNPAPADAGPSAEASATDSDEEGRLLSIRTAEHRRMAALILPEDQSSREPSVRRAAARALARIGGADARPGLRRALSDEDLGVVAWAAYGLGFDCPAKDRPDTVKALAARAATVLSEAPKASEEATLSAFRAIAWAVGGCADKASEAVLTQWLSAPLSFARLAALGVGQLEREKKRLREETIVELLNLAAGSAAREPVPEALFPVARLEHVPKTVERRLFEVASAHLDQPGPFRLYAVRALGRAGIDAIPELLRVLRTPDRYLPAERAEAARALGKFEKPGQAALAEVLPDVRMAALAPDADPKGQGALIGPELGVLLTLLDTLEGPGKARTTLQELATVKSAPKAKPAILRRVSWVRCSAAKILAGSNDRDPLLAGCDVSGDDAVAIGPRSIVDVLARERLSGARGTRFIALAEAGPLRARESALGVLSKHVELKGADGVLLKALEGESIGLVGTAAQALADQPLLARDDKTREELSDGQDAPKGTGIARPEITAALMKLLDGASVDLEVQSSVMAALGALGHKPAVARLSALCQSSYPTTREGAARALALITGKKQECHAPPSGGDKPSELSGPIEPATIAFDTDVGSLEITLSSEFAPMVAGRISGLVRDGYYNDKLVHRVVPGFVTQFGAPEGDGFGGPPQKEPLRCETSLESFERLTVGVALSGRDTGSSQLFVMHAHQPHLEGRYPWIGTAKGQWDALIDGDRIQTARLK